MQSSNIAYVPALDHIRAYAALLALFYHGLQLFWHQAAYGSLFDATHWLATGNPLLALLVEGHTAVALFMVLSGFIFTWGAKGRNIVYRSFIRNRLLRTYPLFIALIVLGISAMPEHFGWPAWTTWRACWRWKRPRRPMAHAWCRWRRGSSTPTCSSCCAGPTRRVSPSGCVSRA